jgi:hypothetical protein
MIVDHAAIGFAVQNVTADGDGLRLKKVAAVSPVGRREPGNRLTVRVHRRGDLLVVTMCVRKAVAGVLVAAFFVGVR